MKKLLLTLLLLLSCHFTWSQKPTCKDSTLWGMMDTPDELYWNKQHYVVANSFLSTFKGYKDIYPDVPITHVVSLSMYGMSNTTNYTPVWLLQDSVLYLRDIQFYESPSSLNRIFPSGKQYTIMEQLTGESFVKNKLKKGLRPPESPAGTMTARWVNGSFYVKKKAIDNEDTKAWEDAPFMKLTFKDGKLVSAEEVTL